MKKTLILVVDRDDDFGAKAGVESPVIGVDDCIAAATALGIADPEDSDTNALYAAINIYREMEADPDSGDFEIALLCGNQKVGYKSDTVVVDQLEEVMGKVNPTRAILVGDGAEDEYIYPIITSRLHVDSVRKVYVKQAPGVEGTFYIFKRIFEDPQKRRRFLGPISWVLVFLAFVYIVSNLFTSGSISNFIKDSTTAFVVFFAGVLVAFYAYNLEDRIADAVGQWSKRNRRGSTMTVFASASAVLVILGVVIGVISTTDIYLERDLQVVLVFLVYSLWFYVFALVIYLFGRVLDGYIYTRIVHYRFVTMILNTLAVGLIICGALDFSMDYSGLYRSNQVFSIIEISSGFVLAVFASILQINMRRKMNMAKGVTEEDA